MRLLPVFLLVAFTSAADADKKTQAMKPGFVKELAACQIEVRGRAKIITGATALLATLEGTEKADLDRDLAGIVAGQTTVSAYCNEVEALVAFLGGVIATADVQPAANRALADEVGKLMFAMLATR